MVTGTKFSQITAAGRNTISSDVVLGRTAAPYTDYTFTQKQTWGGFADQGFTAANILTFGAVGDDSTDDTAALAEAFASGATAIYLPPGIYRTTAQHITVPQTVQYIIGPGIIKYVGLTISNVNLLLIQNHPGPLTITGVGFDLNRTTYGAVGTFCIGLYGTCTNITISNCLFTQSGTIAIVNGLGTATDLRIINNSFANFYESAISLGPTRNLRIVNNGIYANRLNTFGAAVYIFDNVGAVFANNIIDRSYGFSLQFYCSSSFAITGNNFLNQKLEAVRVDADGSGAFATATVTTDWILSDNEVSWPDLAAEDYGFGCSALAGGTLKNGVISGNLIDSSGHAAIALTTDGTSAGGTITRVGVLGNKIINPNQANLAGQPAIQLFADTTTFLNNCTVADNDIWADNTFMDSGVQESFTGSGTLDSNKIARNTIIGFNSITVDMSGTTSLGWDNVPYTNQQTKTSDFSVDQFHNEYICNGGSTITVTLPAATGLNFNRKIYLKTAAAQLVNSASANIVQVAGGGTTNAILAATIGKFAILQSNGTNWTIIASN